MVNIPITLHDWRFVSMGEKQSRLREQLATEEKLGRLACAEHCKIVLAINDELARAGESVEFDTEEIGVTPKGIFERPLGSRQLSRVLTRLGFPSVGQKRVSHYTTYGSFRAIAESRQLRLYAVRKRISEHELRTLLDHLGVRGTDIDPVSQLPAYEELSDHLFYTSFTENRNSSHMWKTFAADATGVRFDFDITANVGDFRSISYALPDSPVVRLFARVRREFNKAFLFRGISKLCAFHLPSFYAPEHEDRMLLAQHTDDYAFPFTVDTDPSGHSYVALPIGATDASHYKIALLGVCPGSACDLETFRQDASRFGIDALVC